MAIPDRVDVATLRRVGAAITDQAADEIERLGRELEGVRRIATDRFWELDRLEEECRVRGIETFLLGMALLPAWFGFQWWAWTACGLAAVLAAARMWRGRGGNT